MKKLLRFFSFLLGVGIIAAIFFALHRELRSLHYHRVLAAIDCIPPGKVLLALACTAGNFLVVGLYELFGFRYVKNSLPSRTIFLTSFIASSFGNTVGPWSISGSSVRYRIYAQEGLSAFDIARLVIFTGGITFWLGLVAFAAFVFLLNPAAIASIIHTAPAVPMGAGLVCLALAAGFIVVAAVVRKPVAIRSVQLELPDPGLSFTLLLLGCLDWLSFGSALYVLLPAGMIGFEAFLAAFVIAQLTGMLSRLPGGIGVAEAVLLFLLRGFPGAPVVAALVVFRAVYFLLPLAASAVILGVNEIALRWGRIAPVARSVGLWGRGIVPQFFAIMIFIGGAILLFSGATPSEHSRMLLLRVIMPLPMIEISHFLASLIGMALLILSYGIYRRYDGAWHLTIYLLAGGALFTFLKGIDYEEALILTVMLAVLLPSRREFYRKGSFINDRLTPGWIIAVAGALASSVWLGFFAYKRVPYSTELWWQFSFGGIGHASRFLRASVGAAGLLFAYSLVMLLSRVKVRIPEFRNVDWTEVKTVVTSRSQQSRSWLSMLGDKSVILSDAKDAFIMYAVCGRSWVALGDPVGNRESFPGLVWKFRELCDQHSAWPVFHEIGCRNKELYLDIGLTLLKIGEEACIDVHNFSLEGSHRKTLRYYMKRLANEGWVFEVVNPAMVPAIMPKLKRISDSWLALKHTREKRFSLGCWNEEYLRQTMLAVVRRNDEIVAFANILVPADQSEYSVDLMRYSATAPNSIMDYLFVNLLLWGKDRGFSQFDMGMAPFSGLEDPQLSPLWRKFAAFLYTHGEEYYNFQGLRRYKEKFDPVWEPRYMAVPGGFALPLILKDVSSLISGGIRGVFAK